MLGTIGAYESTYDGFLDVLGGSPDRLAALVRRAERRVDVAGFGVDELRGVLLAEVQDVGQDVWLAWPYPPHRLRPVSVGRLDMYLT
ncbi:hypothetical protein [Streptomyces cinerochromogenes]|uniref:hypothetical protein n=1 Tax=Streptomyces cinerochromogenes TaxID=66422 RepID=UPI001670EDD2|nr:hypothetical protein [Streptomyces cinerochromogenes]GGS78735.1 hypothetical protein GCM10010206_46470 [Streptomyces cinerochromogenes]